jgi:hypothetical protein
MKIFRNIYFNISAVSGAQITVKREWRLKCNRLGQEAQDPFLGPLYLRTLFHATSTYGDVRKIRYTNLRWHSPFTDRSQRQCVISVKHKGKNPNIVLKFAE